MDILIPGHICCLTFFVGLRHLAFNRCGLISADGVFLIPIDLVGLVAAYGIRHIAGGIVDDILCIVCDSAVFGCIGNSIRLHLNGRFLPICRSDIMPNLISSLIDGAGAFVISHRCLFSIYRLFIGQGFIIPSCILVLDRNGVSFCRFLFKIGFISIDKLFLGLGRSLRISMRILIRVCHLVRHAICCHLGSGFFPVGGVPVFGIIDRPFFIVGELALGGIAMFCYFSQIRDPIRRDGGSAIMLFTGCWIQLIIFQVDLAYIELAIDRQVFLYGDIFLKCCFAFRGQCAIERGIASDTERAADRGILEISIARSELAVYGSRFQLRIPGHGQTFIHLYGFLECRLSSGDERTIDLRIFEISIIRNSQLTIYLCTFQRGIACDRELFIHGHVALEVRSIFHVQRACVHFALRSNIAIASIHATLCCQLTFRSHIANAIDSHIVFDRSFVSNVIVLDSVGAFIGRINSVLIGLNLALELAILRCEATNGCCICFNFFIQRLIDFSAILHLRFNFFLQRLIDFSAILHLRFNFFLQRLIKFNASVLLRFNFLIQRRISRFQIINSRFMRIDVRCIGCHIRRLGILEVSNLRTYLLVQFFSNFLLRQNLICSAGIFIHMHRCFRYAQSSAEERKRKERGESRTAHGLPARTLRMRLRDFRRYHIAILCLGPDDFVDAVHDDFPLCEKQ